jgi:hypothetical protein
MLSNIYAAVNVRIASNLSAPLATLDFMHIDEAKQACDTLEGAAVVRYPQGSTSSHPPGVRRLTR